MMITHHTFDQIGEIEQAIAQIKNQMWEHLSAARIASERVAFLQRWVAEIKVATERPHSEKIN